MTRGRLIFPFMASYRRLDVEAMATVGYDDVYREPILIDDGSPLGASGRIEMDAVLVPAQVEDRAMNELRMTGAGNTPRSEVTVVHHFRDLEGIGLVGDDGMALLRVGDRLEAIYDRDGAKVLDAPAPPGLYVVEARPAGMGLGRRRNLLVVTLRERTEGAPV